MALDTFMTEFPPIIGEMHQLIFVVASIFVCFTQVSSFPPEVEVRAVIESQMMARKLYMELRGMHVGMR